ncbi:MAG: nitrile hydratase accessory protein [Gammaproteobacteria bacterium]
MTKAREDISIMPGMSALPRRSGEMVFHDEWEKRAFAMAVSLCEQGHYEWEEFQAELIAEIDSANEDPENPNPDAPGYYEHWLKALEKVLAKKNLA